VRVCQIYEGTSDIQRLVIGRALAAWTGARQTPCHPGSTPASTPAWPAPRRAGA